MANKPRKKSRRGGVSASAVGLHKFRAPPPPPVQRRLVEVTSIDMGVVYHKAERATTYIRGLGMRVTLATIHVR